MLIHPLPHDEFEALRNHTVEILRCMADVEPIEVTKGAPSQSTIANEIIASIGFTGTVQGIFVLSSTRDVARSIYTGMMGLEESDDSDDGEVADAFGEFLNMVVGNFKNAVVESGKAMDLAIPQVSFGARVSFYTRPVGTIGSVLLLRLPQGNLRIETRIDGPSRDQDRGPESCL